MKIVRTSEPCLGPGITILVWLRSVVYYVSYFVSRLTSSFVPLISLTDPSSTQILRTLHRSIYGQEDILLWHCLPHQHPPQVRPDCDKTPSSPLTLTLPSRSCEPTAPSQKPYRCVQPTNSLPFFLLTLDAPMWRSTLFLPNI
jgi:hypothetical protein